MSGSCVKGDGTLNEVLCLDSTIYLKWLAPVSEVDAGKAIALVEGATGDLAAPAFAWAEVGSALRKKVRMGLLKGNIYLNTRSNSKKGHLLNDSLGEFGSLFVVSQSFGKIEASCFPSAY